MNPKVMKKYLLLLHCLILVGGTNTLPAQNMTFPGTGIPLQEDLALIQSPEPGSGNLLQMKTATCGPDTVKYVLGKTNVLAPFTLSSNLYPSQVCQYFEAPQAIAVNGFKFFARSYGAGSVNVSAQVFLAGADSLPTGVALATVIVPVDSTGANGNLSLLGNIATFATPAVVSAPYVLVVNNNNLPEVDVYFNDFGEGAGEYLMGFFLAGQWWASKDPNVGPIDQDWLVYPIVEYVINASFTVSSTCLSVAGTRTFTNNSSAIFDNRFYNQIKLNTGSVDDSFTWDFGDGSPKVNANNISHTYSISGALTVTLTDSIQGWSMGYCSTDTTFTFKIGPSVNFSSSAVNKTVTFTDMTSGGTILGRTWDFGDGQSSNSQNPIYTYAAAGTYTVCLTVVDNCGTDSTCKSVTAGCAAQNAAFTSSSFGLTANFTDATSGSPTAWAWLFGDGGSAATQNPSHTYSAPGTFTVCLTIADSCGSDSSCNSITLVNCTEPTAAFSQTAAGLVVTFTDQSTTQTTISTWLWDFGDGNTSASQNPSHTYTAPDTVLVCLTVTDSCTDDSTCTTLIVDSTIAMDRTLPMPDITLFPNPTGEKFEVYFSQGPVSGFVIEITDMAGRQIFESAIDAIGQIHQVNMGLIPDGTYSVKILLDNSPTYHRLLVRNQ